MRQATLAAIGALCLAAPPARGEGDDTPKLVTLLGIPSAAIAPNRAAFAAFAYSNRSRVGGAMVDEPDSSLGFGAVIGDAGQGLGLQLGATFIGLSSDPTFSGLGPGQSGHLSLQAAHLLGTGTPTFIAVAADHLAGWGTAQNIDPALSAMVTAFPTTRIGGKSFPLMLTLGLGDHVRNDGADPGAFAGIGIGLDPHFGLSAAWTGETVTLGGTFKPEGLRNWSFSAQLDDAFDQQDSQRVTISATVLFENAFGG